jgi:hypothetical protein
LFGALCSGINNQSRTFSVERLSERQHFRNLGSNWLSREAWASLSRHLISTEAADEHIHGRLKPNDRTSRFHDSAILFGQHSTTTAGNNNICLT